MLGPPDARAPVQAAGSPEPATGRTLPIEAVRGVQFGLDLVVSSVLCLLPLGLSTAFMQDMARNPDGTLEAPLALVPILGLGLLAAIVLSWLYWALLAALLGGRTPAMVLLGLRVVGPDNRAAGTAAMTLRWLGLAVDAMLLGLVGLAVMLLTDRSQRVGDLMAATEVVRSRRR